MLSFIANSYAAKTVLANEIILFLIAAVTMTGRGGIAGKKEDVVDDL